MYQWLRNFVACFTLREDSDPLGRQDHRLWSEDVRRHAYGEFSLAVVEANVNVEDKSLVEAGRLVTFVGVYDGHGGPYASEFVARHLFNHLKRLARDRRELSENIITNAVAETESGYLDHVKRLRQVPSGSCCLVGAIVNRKLYVGNMGDSRAVLGVSYKKRIRAEQLTKDHNVNLKDIRIDLQTQHSGDPTIVVKRNGRWRVKDVLEVTRAIGDFNLKYKDLAAGPSYPESYIGEPLARPYIRDEPEVHRRELEEDCKFVIFASDGLWDFMSNQEAVDIVHKGPRVGIARRLAVKAMKNAAKKRRTTYTDLKDLNPGERRNFHDDITVVVVYIDRLEQVDGLNFHPITVRGSENIVRSDFDF